MGHWLRVVGASIICGVVTLAAAQPASAERYAAADPSADMQYFAPPNSPDPPTDAPDHVNADMTHSALRYGDKRVSLRIKFNELDHSDRVLMLGAAFRYSAQHELHYSDAFITARVGNWRGHAHMSGAAVGCPIEHRLDFAANVLSLSFPVDCFASPRWLQFNAVAVASDRVALDDATYLYADRAPGTLRGERWAPRIHQG